MLAAARLCLASPGLLQPLVVLAPEHLSMKYWFPESTLSLEWRPHEMLNMNELQPPDPCLYRLETCRRAALGTSAAMDCVLLWWEGII